MLEEAPAALAPSPPWRRRDAGFSAPRATHTLIGQLAWGAASSHGAPSSPHKPLCGCGGRNRRRCSPHPAPARPAAAAGPPPALQKQGPGAAAQRRCRRERRRERRRRRSARQLRAGGPGGVSSGCLLLPRPRVCLPPPLSLATWALRRREKRDARGVGDGGRWLMLICSPFSPLAPNPFSQLRAGQPAQQRHRLLHGEPLVLLAACWDRRPRSACVRAPAPPAPPNERPPPWPPNALHCRWRCPWWLARWALA